MTRIRILDTPTFDIETGRLLSHCGESFVDVVPIRCDRSAVKQSKADATQSRGVTGQSQANANIDRSSVIPGLIQDATHPTGYNPVDVNNMLVSGAQAVGGVNSGLLGNAELTSAANRNAGGYNAALGEAARQKMAQLSNNALGVQEKSADLAQEKQQAARKGLLGLYDTDTSDMLKSMGITNEDEQTRLAAGRQGWLQNTLDTIGTIGKAAGGVAGAGKLAGIWGGKSG